MKILSEFLTESLESIKEENLYRTTGDKVYKETDLIFSSNDYLGLAKRKANPKNNSRIGSGGSRLTTGTHQIHHDVEDYIAKWKGAEAAIIFSSGYMANIGVLAALMNPRDVVYSDELNHSSLLDGIRLSKVNKYIYRHNDTEHLESLLKSTRSKKQKALIVTDTVFGMDGDKAKLNELSRLAKEYNASLYVDEAHGTGILGKTGAGLVEEASLNHNEVEIQMGTLSKAVGAEGGYVVGSKDLIRFIKNKCRSFIYTTSMSPFIMQEILDNLKVIAEDNALREKLWENIEYLRSKLKDTKLKWQNEGTAIFPVFLGDTTKTLEASAKLKEAGIIIPAIRPPTAPTARLRLTLSAAHSHEDIDKLVEALESL